MELIYFIIAIYFLVFFCTQFQYILLGLMALEFSMLGVFLNLYLNLNEMELNLWILMYFLVFMVCDSVLGLSLMVLLIRYYGNGYVSYLMLNLW